MRVHIVNIKLYGLGLIEHFPEQKKYFSQNIPPTKVRQNSVEKSSLKNNTSQTTPLTKTLYTPPYQEDKESKSSLKSR